MGGRKRRGRKTMVEKVTKGGREARRKRRR